MSSTHELEWVKTLRSGAQVWRCPTCGHWVIVYPTGEGPKKIILHEGNKLVSHHVRAGSAPAHTPRGIGAAPADSAVAGASA